MEQSKARSGVDIQTRDLLVLRGLLESRVMICEHVASIYFGGSKESAKKRLHKLKAGGYIGARRRMVTKPELLFLTRQGLRLLHEHDALSGLPGFSPASFERRTIISPLTLSHELEVMDVKAAFYLALSKSTTFSIAEFSTWPLLYEFEARRPGQGAAEKPVKPDGYIRIHEKEDGANGYFRDFFLEVDRSTEPPIKLVSQAHCYFDFYSSGQFAIRQGVRPEEYKKCPFRVLMVFKSAERRNNVAERLLQSGMQLPNLVWFTTLQEICDNPLGPVWVLPSEYRKSTAGTLFDPDRTGNAHGYRRQTPRERFIETIVQKQRLLAG